MRQSITHLIGFASFLLLSNASAQQSAVHNLQEGNKVFLRVHPDALKADLDTLFANSASAQTALNNLSWSEVLENGTTPGMDVDFFGYNASGLGQVTTSGTFTGDSLVLNKDAAISGKLNVTGVVSMGDSLTVTGVVDFADSLHVIKSVSIGERLYVTGITALGDSLHVVGNVDLDALFNVDGAATFGSTLTVSGKTTLNDSLLVNSGANISGTVTADSISVTDVINGQVNDISNHDSDDLSEGSSNLYYTDARARASVSGSTGVTYNSTTGAISIGQAVGTSNDVTFADVTADSLITSALRVEDGSQAAGKVLTADANGNATWQDAATTLSAGTGIDITDDVVSIGQAVATTDDVTFADVTADSLITSALRVQDGNQAAGKVLTADANGNASWQDAASALSAGTGVTITNDEVSIGQAVGTTDDVTFDDITADSLTVEAFIYADGSQGPNKVLQSDGTGKASWVSVPQMSPFNPSMAIFGELAESPNVASNTSQYNTGSYIDLPPGIWYVQGTTIIKSDASNGAGTAIWVRSSFSTSASSFVPANTMGSNQIAGSQVWPAAYGLATGSVVIQNNGASVRRYYWWSGGNDVHSGNPAGTLYGFGGSQWGETALMAIAIEEYIESASVSSNAASSVNTTTADLNGEVTSEGGDAVTATGFVWSINSDLSDGASVSGSSTSGTFTASLSGLSECTTYYYQAFAVNGGGTSNGAILSFTTSGTAPTMTIAAAEVSDGAESQDASLALTFTASQSTSDFDASDVTVNNGSLSNFAGSGTTYTATFTPDGEGACTIDVGAGAFNGTCAVNNAADTFNWTYDTTSPTMTITAAEVSAGDSSSTATVSLTFTSSESTADFAQDDITVTNGTLSSFAGSGATYTATFTPDGEGACTINVAGSTFTDEAGNPNTAAQEFTWTKTAAPALTATWSINGSSNTYAQIATTHNGSTADGWILTSSYGSEYSYWGSDNNYIYDVLPETAGTEDVVLTPTGDSGENITFTPATITLTMTCYCTYSSYTTKTECEDDTNEDWRCDW